MLCRTCQQPGRKFGRDRDGNQRYQCQQCRKTFSERPARPLGDMRLSLDKALIVLHHLVEGVSVRATMRLTGVNRNTILDLLALMGERCERLLAGLMNKLSVVDVQLDEAKMPEGLGHMTPPDWWCALLVMGYMTGWRV